MRIGIIGAGNCGSTLAELFVRAGHDVTLSHEGAPEELHDLIARLGSRAHAATTGEAARTSDVVVLAVPFASYRELPPEAFTGKIVIDATNYYPERDGELAELDVFTSSELIDRQLGEARLVKAFNSVPMSMLRAKARPRGASDRIALPVSSDDPQARRVVIQLIDDAGFDAVELGGLVDGGRLHQKGGPLYLKRLTREQLLAGLGIGGEQPPAP
jgi:8-hydroxy-5-deazaflavin:NADPH oxidoreductase